MATKFRDVFLGSVDAFHVKYLKNPDIEPGMNGPHQQAETALRVSAHWVVSLCRAYELTSIEAYKNSAINICSDILSKKFRPHGFAFHARTQPNVDRCNGLIGQAWTIEALAEMHSVTGDDAYQLAGIELANQHKFDKKFGLWHSLDIDGKHLNIDNVFNHQLWFCAALALVNNKKDAELNEKIRLFMDNIERNLTISENGLIEHLIKRAVRSPKLRFQGVVKHLRQGSFISRLKSGGKIKNISDPNTLNNGYHAFNTHAFAMLKPYTSQHPFWQSEKFSSLINYISTSEYSSAVDGSIYGFPYNPPGFEVPFSLEVLSGHDADTVRAASQVWLDRQIRFSYDPQSKMMDRNCIDKPTQSARLYEASRFSDHLMESLTVDIHSIDQHDWD